ncbi:unnamed protein product [Microthlaspi erraticum]|uniref:Uncharacterized protein n=1 Tax=Microthlaspi erraticum TaxID=1685480 RepID=A0A6D2IXY7_9BRAS|nr:unnamed protein product [Microthlaspi erraticum]
MRGLTPYSRFSTSIIQSVSSPAKKFKISSASPSDRITGMASIRSRTLTVSKSLAYNHSRITGQRRRRRHHPPQPHRQGPQSPRLRPHPSPALLTRVCSQWPEYPPRSLVEFVEGRLQVSEMEI